MSSVSDQSGVEHQHPLFASDSQYGRFTRSFSRVDKLHGYINRLGRRLAQEPAVWGPVVDKDANRNGFFFFRDGETAACDVEHVELKLDRSKNPVECYLTFKFQDRERLPGNFPIAFWCGLLQPEIIDRLGKVVGTTTGSTCDLLAKLVTALPQGDRELDRILSTVPDLPGEIDADRNARTQGVKVLATTVDVEEVCKHAAFLVVIDAVPAAASIRPEQSTAPRVWPFPNQDNLVACAACPGELPLQKAAKKTLEAGQREVGASSCVFYIRDPAFPDLFRPLFMSGVEHPELMEGFSTQAEAKEQRPPEVFVPNVPARESSEVVSGPLWEERKNLASTKAVFQRFVEREKVASFARFLLPGGGDVQAALYVNYFDPQTFKEDQKRVLRGLGSKMVALLPGLYQELERPLDAVQATQAIRIAQPAEQLLRLDKNTSRDPKILQNKLRQSLADILAATCRTFRMDPTDSIGIIQLFEQEATTLSPEAFLTNLPVKLTELSVAKGMGIVSLIALRRCSVLVRDLEDSVLKDVFRELIGDSRSVLAAPILDGGDLLGTICLDSRKPDHFTKQPIGLLWHAAKQIALVYRVVKHAFHKEKLEQAKDDAFNLERRLRKGEASKRLLGDLARLTFASADAGACHLWRYAGIPGQRPTEEASEVREAFRVEDCPEPRPDGVSDYVCRTSIPVWITGVEGASDQMFFWDDKDKQWEPPTKGKPTRLRPHPALLEQELSRLYIPIQKSTEEPVGCAWLTYRVERPTTAGRDVSERLFAPLVPRKSPAKGLDEPASEWVPSIETMELARAALQLGPELFDDESRSHNN